MKNYIEQNYGQVNIGEQITINNGSVIKDNDPKIYTELKTFSRKEIFNEFQKYSTNIKEVGLLKEELEFLLNEKNELEKRKGAFQHLKEFADKNIMDIQNSVIGGLLVEIAKNFI